jgi:alpha-ketoglutarate-dependent taurine dioxygenase
MSYTRTWPLKIWFLCVKSAEQGGETPLADSARVYEHIDPKISERFSAKGVKYVRNYGNGLDLSWQDVFQTSDKSEVEAYCRKNNIEFRWMGDQGLRTGQRCQAVARHEPTGKMVWFNQAHLFHVSSLDPKVRESLASQFSEEDFPRNAFYGDGEAIEPEALANIRGAYQDAERVFPWREGDIALVDNMLVAHGRRPYSGSRKIVVGMAESSTNSELTL